MSALSDMLSAFKTKQSRLASGLGMRPPQTPATTLSREDSPASNLTNDGRSGDHSPFHGASPGPFPNPMSSAMHNSSEMDLDDDDDVRSTRLTALMGEHEASDGGLSGGNTGHTLSKYQDQVRAAACKYTFTSEQFDELMLFVELSPVEMLMSIKFHYFRTENDILKRFMRIFVRHPDFLIRLRHSVAAGLLAPNIPAYVEGLYPQFTKHLEDNAKRLLGVPDSQKSDPADWALIKSAIAIELANLRSAMKLKIDGSIKNSLDIYGLTFALLKKNGDLRPKTEHWGRFAFLRQCTVVFNKTPAHARGDYWKHIDQCLMDVRKSANDEYPRPEDTLARKQHETLLIAHFLETDINDFPLKSGAVARTVYTNAGLMELQYSTEKVVGAFVADDSPVPTAGAARPSAVEHSASEDGTGE